MHKLATLFNGDAATWHRLAEAAQTQLSSLFKSNSVQLDFFDAAVAGFTKENLVMAAKAKETRNKSRPKNLKMIENDPILDEALAAKLGSLIEKARTYTSSEPNLADRAKKLMSLSANKPATKLAKGSGPCTSSFVLAHFCPDLFPFYCQKQWETVAQVKALKLDKECKFTEAQGAVFYAIVLELVELINSNRTDDKRVTPLDVSNVLWYSRIKGGEILDQILKPLELVEGGSAVKVEGGEDDVLEADTPPKKKRRMVME
ncbi:UNVERIFIED_CONTAM: hypothetical protein HDU68_006884 [Siphonaria sp. JEL0065]|nr:hypothetical protein HDU68_006884 [Siphonaria sp. JEL0065]